VVGKFVFDCFYLLHHKQKQSAATIARSELAAMALAALPLPLPSSSLIGWLGRLVAPLGRAAVVEAAVVLGLAVVDGDVGFIVVEVVVDVVSFAKSPEWASIDARLTVGSTVSRASGVVIRAAIGALVLLSVDVAMIRLSSVLEGANVVVAGSARTMSMPFLLVGTSSIEAKVVVVAFSSLIIDVVLTSVEFMTMLIAVAFSLSTASWCMCSPSTLASFSSLPMSTSQKSLSAAACSAGAAGPMSTDSGTWRISRLGRPTYGKASVSEMRTRDNVRAWSFIFWW